MSGILAFAQMPVLWCCVEIFQSTSTQPAFSDCVLLSPRRKSMCCHHHCVNTEAFVRILRATPAPIQEVRALFQDGTRTPPLVEQVVTLLHEDAAPQILSCHACTDKLRTAAKEYITG
jgi:hypothetical protein